LNILKKPVFKPAFFCPAKKDYHSQYANYNG